MFGPISYWDYLKDTSQDSLSLNQSVGRSVGQSVATNGTIFSKGYTLFSLIIMMSMEKRDTLRKRVPFQSVLCENSTPLSVAYQNTHSTQSGTKLRTGKTCLFSEYAMSTNKISVSLACCRINQPMFT